VTTERLSSFIVDHEVSARRRMRRLVTREASTDLVGEAATKAEAIELIERCHPDMVFCDVELPDGEGIDVLRQTSSWNEPAFIFVADHGQHAAEAFEVRAVDYILKPVSAERIFSAIRRAREMIESTPSRYRGQSRSPTRMAVSAPDGRLILIRIASIEMIQSSGNYVRVHHDGSVHTYRDTLAAVESRLDPYQFARVHKRTIVNIDAIASIEPTGNGDFTLTMQDGHLLRLSRRYRERIHLLVGNL
jgi:two-component system LytT family response regulator